MKIARHALESVTAQALESFPAECCGILLAAAGDPSLAVEAMRADNAETECPAEKCVLGHKAHIEAVRMEAAGAARVVGYYHSHPRAAPEPSALDNRLAVPGVSYLIIGVQDGLVAGAAWRLDADRLVAEPMEVRD